MNKNRPIVGWLEWTFTACLWLLAIASLYFEGSKLPRPASGVDEGQASRPCLLIEETP